MRSRDLLLSGADYDWITNYYTKWITGHEISRTDTRYTMYKTSWTTEWETTETVTVTKPGKTRVYIDISTTGGGAIGGIPDPIALDPNSNKWMESREDRQANQSNSKNLYSNNKNELLQTPSNKRNLQTYYVHNEPVS